jgi:hypothetical protein
MVATVPEARWSQFNPFDLYRPTSRSREIEAGPHLTFLRLSALWKAEEPSFSKALILFAEKHGLLGAFEEDYLQDPIYPEGKMLVAPEAEIDAGGRLRRVDPATEGRDLLLDLLEPRGWLPRKTGREVTYAHIALPSEVRFISKKPNLDSQGWPVENPRQLVPWEEISEDFGGLLLLDEGTFKGVSILCTREPLRRWITDLRFFHSGDSPVELLVGDYPTTLNSYISETSPRTILGEDGNLTRGWHYRSLLQAMHLMVYLDLTGGNTVKRCRSRGCPNYFRIGPQSESKYCSGRCAYRASTLMRRGQKP